MLFPPTVINSIATTATTTSSPPPPPPLADHFFASAYDLHVQLHNQANASLAQESRKIQEKKTSLSPWFP